MTPLSSSKITCTRACSRVDVSSQQQCPARDAQEPSERAAALIAIWVGWGVEPFLWQQGAQNLAKKFDSARFRLFPQAVRDGRRGRVERGGVVEHGHGQLPHQDDERARFLPPNVDGQI